MTKLATELVTADEALDRLLAGNRRFSAGQLARPRQTPAHRLSLAAEQRPVAAVLGCCDSRLPPELIFDQGLGDLYVVRVAGNVVDSLVLGSLELAVVALNVPLIVVLGHDQCAAIASAVQLAEGGAGSGPSVPAGHLGALVLSLKPVVENTPPGAGSLADRAIDANISRSVAQLQASGPVLAERCQQNKLRVVGARYGFSTGEVSLVA